jgi:diaminohydroxyphosphoribosylaminopyrimidine deaminase/5-amino-6-(5-phosphoribosylamino)uracil reductase
MHQAILVGVETAIADDPELTVRMPGFVGIQPVRVVLDSRQRLPLTSKLVKDAERLPTVVITVENPNNRLTDAGVTVIQVAQSEGRPEPRAVVEALQGDFDRRLVERFGGEASGSTAMNLMIEGGGQVAASFLSAGLVDQIEWFRAPMILGDEGRPAIGAFVLKDLAAAPRFRRLAIEMVGDDLWERYGKA